MRVSGSHISVGPGLRATSKSTPRPSSGISPSTGSPANAKVFDPRNASFDELTKAASELYKSGQIDLRDLAVLTLDTSRLQQPQHARPFLTSDTRNGKIDWVAELGARADRARTYGSQLSYENNRRVQDILANA